MRVLVTGATGSFGTPICRELAHRGVEVLAMARSEPARLPSGVRFVRGDVQDKASVAGAVDGVDAVLHLAWLVASAREAEQAERININGTQNILDAMRERGVPRFVFASSVMGYGSQAGHGPYREDEPLRADEGFLYGHHKKLVEARIKDSGVPYLVVRTAPVVGRGVRNVVTDQFAGPAITGVAGDTSQWQFVHSDDVTRFLIDSVDMDATGVVNLAAEGGLTLERVAELLDKPVVRLPYGVAKGMIRLMWKAGISDVDPAAMDALRYLPVADTSKLREDFGFRCAWTNEEAVEDMRRSLTTYVHFGTLEAKRRSYVPFTEPGWRPDLSPWPGRELALIGPSEYRGEFDDRVEPDMSLFSGTNVAEAFPGPLTPLSLELALVALRAGTEVTVRLVGLDGWLAHEAQSRFVASFAHRIYLNVSLVREIYKRMPGSSPEEADAQYCGIALPDDYKRPRLTWAEIRAAGKLARKGGLAMARYSLSEQWLLDETDRLANRKVDPATLTDAELEARIGLLIDSFVDSQVVNVNAALVGGAALAAAERRSGGHGVTAGSLASTQTLTGVHRVAAIVREDTAARDALDEYRNDPEAMRHIGDKSPKLHAALTELLASVGHRGPGEFELANRSFSDRPMLLLEAVLRAASGPVREERVHTSDGLLQKMAASSLQRRERIRDASVRIFHQLRLALREKGSRLSGAGVLDSPDDIYYLTIDEMTYPPTDVVDRVSRRRTERQKLADIEMPAVVDGDWQPVSAPTDSLTEMSGHGVSNGVIRGRVRLLTDPEDGLEPGEVLVCRVTDVGWTPLFAAAAAVVSEIGGSMSHTAVVAREFGIPAVVGVEMATHHLRDGQVVEVDGGAGTVKVLDDDAAPFTPAAGAAD
jgi:nucleoside-diphosphate-sugar epimerase/phosphohistidine swiveling domain-containing protein